MSIRRSRITVLALVAACAAPEAPPVEEATAVAVAPPEVAITLTDYAFALPDTVAPGVTAIRIVNQGERMHHAILARIDSGKTMADVEAMMSQPAAPTPGWVKIVGGGGAVKPGGSNVTVSDLQPGLHVLICFLQDAGDQPPHVALGMVRPFTVAGERGSATLPVASGEIRMSDYTYDLPTLAAGEHTLHVVNDGTEEHEIAVARIPDGMTFEAFMAALRPDAEPDAQPIGGNGALSPGESNWWKVTLAPGTYAVLCWVPSPDGTPHVMKGMARPLVVEPTAL